MIPPLVGLLSRGQAATTTGWKAHADAVRRLQESYRALPADAPVRLAKRTSNLFRPREVLVGSGLDVSGLGGVIEVDAEARTAEVQGMCTYEDLVDATLPHGLAPLVVPQLRTITLGGAVTGLGIESTSFRHGLPHESVLEMDVFTGAGEVVTCGPTGEHADLFRAFPNSYGSLGYATRLRIELMPVTSHVALRHVRFTGTDALQQAIAEVTDTGAWEGEAVDAMDGTSFEPGRHVLTLGRFVEADGPGSDYAGQQVYWRSVGERETDLLTTYDYLWRWDTDWFWCSQAFGAQHPVVRRIWPRRLRRSDSYHRLVGLDQRFDVMNRLDRRAGRPRRERVVQDIEVPVERLGEFLDWFDEAVGMRPVWLCPLRLRDAEAGTDPWPTYPLEPARTYVNVGFWGAVPVGDDAPDSPLNRAIEAKVAELDGHKSLYSESFYDRETFDRLYDGPHLAAVKQRYDPHDRLTSLYDKAVRRR
ncbi:FAD/FMN-containing dehydrogenase [Nocardioides scoriae]|uniref:Delta(24)-sterol reductase n=1 Tax=Nocardioides scoriae TaxID=642780 RepID=A0A1H1M3H1_9ACTN|nr:FAD-binding oxidoreductase [Nocardioides scoriae]SDR81321.1 FAD/FMN-containing dehydrogenase [Nocardioides scoriae]